MIRTLVEIQGGRVSIQETAAETTVTVTVDSEMSGPGEKWLAARRESDGSWRDSLNRNQLLTEIEWLESELKRRTKERDEREQARANLEKSTGEEIRKLRAQVAEYDRDRKSESKRAATWQDQAGQNRARAERAEAELDEKNSALANQVHLLHGPNGVHARLAQTIRDRDRLAAKIGKVNGAVHSPEILKALQYDWDNWDGEQYEAMTNAVREVRQIVGSPEPETSQA